MFSFKLRQRSPSKSATEMAGPTANQQQQQQQQQLLQHQNPNLQVRLTVKSVHLLWQLKNILKPNRRFFCRNLVLVSFHPLLWSWILHANSPQSPPSLLKDYSICNNARLISTAPGFWSKWMVPEKWSPQWGFEPTTSQSWDFCLNH